MTNNVFVVTRGVSDLDRRFEKKKESQRRPDEQSRQQAEKKNKKNKKVFDDKERSIMDVALPGAKSKMDVALALSKDALALVMENQEIVAPAVVCLVSFAYSWLVTRAVIVGGGAAVFVLAPEDLTTPCLWAYALVAFLASFLFGKAKKKGLPPPTKAAAYVEGHRRKLVAFYEVHAPEKVSEVDSILAKYRGHETAMWERLEKKYETKEPAPAAYVAPDKKTTPSRPSALDKAREDFKRATDARREAIIKSAKKGK